MNHTSPFNAFKYMFMDNKIWSKFAVFFILIFMSFLPHIAGEASEQMGIIRYIMIYSLLCIIAFGAQILYYGYFASCIKSLTEQNQNFLLPMFNFKKDGFLGLKYFAGSLLLGIALVCAMFIIGIILAIIFGILYIFNQVLASIIGLTALVITTILFIVLSVLYFPSAVRLFSVTQDPLEFFNFKEIIRLIKENSDIYYKYIGVSILGSLLLCVVFVITFLPCCLIVAKSPLLAVILMFLSIAAIGVYANTISVYIIAKCIR